FHRLGRPLPAPPTSHLRGAQSNVNRAQACVTSVQPHVPSPYHRKAHGPEKTTTRRWGGIKPPCHGSGGISRGGARMGLGARRAGSKSDLSPTETPPPTIAADLADTRRFTLHPDTLLIVHEHLLRMANPLSIFKGLNNGVVGSSHLALYASSLSA